MQTYTYDELNRLKSATENSTPNNSSTASQSWKQTYTYDRFGNRRFDTSSGATTTIPGGCSTAECNPTFNLANNHYAGSQDYDYDYAGNVTEEANGKKFVYDAENKQKSFGTGGDDDNGGTYFYDADGHRVKKIVGSEVTIFVYDASNQLVAEYTTTAPTSPQVNYLTADTLGTPRINTDSTGTVIARHDYMPFGEETLAGRASALGYGGDNVRQKFTGKERDAETGDDYFLARYSDNGLGRFLSADPLFLDMKRLGDPQLINLYVYTRNNPLHLTDPTGLEVYVDGDALAEYINALGNCVSFKVRLNPETNKVEIVDEDGNVLDENQLKALGETLKDKNKEMFKAITDPNVIVSITSLSVGSSRIFFGSVRSPGAHDIAWDQTSLLDDESVQVTGISSDEIVGHETLEAYYEKEGAGMSNHDAHNKANPFYTGFNDKVSAVWGDLTNTHINSVVFDIPVYRTGALLEVEFRFNTPIPRQSIPTTAQPGIPVDVQRKPW